jgi:predicted double-glycine peptidase
VVRSLAEIRSEQVVRQQWDLTCGAAAIATLLTYQLGHPVTEREVALAMLHRTSPALVRARLGFSFLDLKIYAASQGFGAKGFARMTLQDLDAYAPAITPIRVHGFNHFVVYRGRRDGSVLIADPSYGNRTLSEDAFSSSWAGGLAFVVFDPAEPHPPNRMGAPAELFLMPGRPAEHAVSSVRAESDPCPDSRSCPSSWRSPPQPPRPPSPRS